MRACMTVMACLLLAFQGPAPRSTVMAAAPGCMQANTNMGRQADAFPAVKAHTLNGSFFLLAPRTSSRA